MREVLWGFFFLLLFFYFSYGAREEKKKENFYFLNRFKSYHESQNTQELKKEKLERVKIIKKYKAQKEREEKEKERYEKIKRIDNYLKRWKSPMVGLGYVFVREGEKTGVNPYLPVAISAIESGCGRRSSDNNPFGYLKSGEGSGLRRYKNWEAAIIDIFRFLRRRWGKAQTSYDLPGYCVPSSPWQEKVEREMRKI